eukprot:5606862-Pyramimonas_sp.AAC.1
MDARRISLDSQGTPPAGPAWGGVDPLAQVPPAFYIGLVKRAWQVERRKERRKGCPSSTSTWMQR